MEAGIAARLVPIIIKTVLLKAVSNLPTAFINHKLKNLVPSLTEAYDDNGSRNRSKLKYPQSNIEPAYIYNKANLVTSMENSRDGSLLAGCEYSFHITLTATYRPKPTRLKLSPLQLHTDITVLDSLLKKMSQAPIKQLTNMTIFPILPSLSRC